ncbi:MAG TPA: hypothetical protein DDW50_20375 [Firmicutes bacterium]|jgi:hypothetical protein|nr:hypothetical protein [Bacillota bacterium]
MYIAKEEPHANSQRGSLFDLSELYSGDTSIVCPSPAEYRTKNGQCINSFRKMAVKARRKVR